MLTLLLSLFVLILIYAFIVRPLLKQQPVLSTAFKAEASFLEKVQAKVTGWKTKITSRLITIAGIFVTLYDHALPYISGQDWTPITAKLPSWALPVGLVGVGLIFEWLHNVTANPPQVIVQADDAGEKKVVAVIQPAS